MRVFFGRVARISLEKAIPSRSEQRNISKMLLKVGIVTHSDNERICATANHSRDSCRSPSRSTGSADCNRDTAVEAGYQTEQDASRTSRVQCRSGGCV